MEVVVGGGINPTMFSDMEIQQNQSLTNIRCILSELLN